MYSLTVIVPTYNREKQTIGALESILKQNEAVDEIILIDDGSTTKVFNALARLLL